jgi:HK97 family phage major capsid protein
MDNPNIDPELQPIHDGIKGIQHDFASQKQTIEQIKADLAASEAAYKEWQQRKDAADLDNKKAIDELIKKANSFSFGASESGFVPTFRAAIAEKFESIKGVRKGSGFAFEMKGDMTTANSITGNLVRTQLQPAILPNQIFNFRDLVEVVQTSTGLITLPRETTPTGSASRVAENTAKPQIEPKFTMVDFKADYIAGYARVSKQMLQDLLFLQTFLPRILLREFYKAENLQFYTDLTLVASGSTTTGATAYVEKLIDWMANLGGANFAPNGMVGTFAEWAALLKTTSGTGYSLPGAATIGPDGAVRIAGIPFRPANWVASGKTIVGDFTQALIAVADTLKVEFFEQDQDNVIKNLVTVRVEAREVLVIEQPAAFIFA